MSSDHLESESEDSKRSCCFNPKELLKYLFSIVDDRVKFLTNSFITQGKKFKYAIQRIFAKIPFTGKLLFKFNKNDFRN